MIETTHDDFVTFSEYGKQLTWNHKLVTTQVGGSCKCVDPIGPLDACWKITMNMCCNA